VEKRGGLTALGLGGWGVALIVALLIADGQSEADLADDLWFRALLVLAVLAIGVAAWALFSTYVHPLPGIPTAQERRDSKNASEAKQKSRKKYMEKLRDVLVGRENRAAAELEDGRHTNRLFTFSQWVQTNRRGINKDAELHPLLATWDPLLVCADAHHETLQAAWDAADADGFPPFAGQGDRDRLRDLLAAIIDARRAVQALLRE